MNALNTVNPPKNEPIFKYLKGSKERERLFQEYDKMWATEYKIPLIIGGKEIFTEKTQRIVCPHDHQHNLGTYCMAGAKEIQMAIDAAMAAKAQWENLDWFERVSIFLKAAELISTKYRYILNAATMIGQSKNIFQAEIDATCELADFFRFNAKYVEQIYRDQPESTPGYIDRVEYRPLEGFILAITPFNFTSIAGNLPSAPAMMGNVAVWKPSSTSVLSNYYLMKLFHEAGLPDGVINFIPCRGTELSAVAMTNKHYAGVHFTGSTEVFRQIWKTSSENLDKLVSYPRIVGETGGKDFIFAHPSADLETLSIGLVQGSFEFQGQKCSAASRAYIPESIWPEVKERMGKAMKEFKMGTPREPENFINAVIDKVSFDKTMSYINYAKDSKDAEIVFGGNGNDSKGYFIEPTVIKTTDPKFKSMQEEIFAPVLTIYVYKDDQVEETLTLLDETSPYALTGSIFARDRHVIKHLANRLTHCAGNFYINDKPTGAIVGQQPFGGARASGTNDKAGSYLNLIRWASPRTIKENFNANRDWQYEYMK
ncbi:MAG TPA: L-glutamate gamma-semialdehyde dehydrogenase [Candidatus Cloacimonadota bacterium]|nr:L-glutamate gamma-semialdehyde dehydrogenase [Candidatus Cloacimonadota bacterium]HPK40100.1 L-glutamate gamma-semialdehyde dehydrogenase [Candidatus Cloacimonadota bacterium]